MSELKFEVIHDCFRFTPLRVEGESSGLKLILKTNAYQYEKLFPHIKKMMECIDNKCECIKSAKKQGGK